MWSGYNLLPVSLYTSLTIIFLWMERKDLAVNLRNTELSKLTYVSGTKTAGCRDLQIHSNRMILHCPSVKCSFYSPSEKRTISSLLLLGE